MCSMYGRCSVCGRCRRPGRCSRCELGKKSRPLKKSSQDSRPTFGLDLTRIQGLDLSGQSNDSQDNVHVCTEYVCVRYVDAHCQ